MYIRIVDMYIHVEHIRIREHGGRGPLITG